ncbi:GNAT family N-acetyltransferase [Pseudarthrobacter sp. NamE5]|uniref:GNAT family N-acetyltransferase n=1 Tax=Pseudarthrobacter sp. NamE5 TaxID=2576839 RepID=UPI00110BC2B8|nr:GNAT family N-acetyltransferase [Pseudarthrobacter sp. NamE5]TLM83479.1 GNAT family N-acetyltransferase [Pseudarthrobacter sp. NamE5]
MIEENVARELWREARALGDTPSGEWTFPLHVCRAVASRPDGLDWSYEHLSGWEELLELDQLVTELTLEGDIEPHQIYSVTLGVHLFDESFYSVTGEIPLPEESEPYRGRHAVQMAGFEGDSLVFVGSWGSRWGDNGFGYLSRSYFEKHVDLILAVRPAIFGPSLKLDNAWKAYTWQQGRPGQFYLSDLRDLWFTENAIRAKIVTLNNTEHSVARRQLFDFHNRPFEIVELRVGNELCGRLHLIHNFSEGKSLIDELWVPPQSRRNGYGTYLAELAVELSQGRRLHARLHEADSQGYGLSRAEDFADKVGYTCEYLSTTRPNLALAATRKDS